MVRAPSPYTKFAGSVPGQSIRIKKKILCSLRRQLTTAHCQEWPEGGCWVGHFLTLSANGHEAHSKYLEVGFEFTATFIKGALALQRGVL